MIIRELNHDDYAAAAELKVYSFDEEVSGRVENMLSSHKQRMQMESWIDSAEEYNDIRVLYAAFEGDEFIGFTGGSIAEDFDSKNRFELNYLFVNEKHRGKNISLRLLKELTGLFLSKKFKEMIVYNYSVSPSNKYYRKLDGKVVRSIVESQTDLSVDIFSFDLEDLHNILESKTK